jgi:RNA polymerase sigma-70 factor, ECF subfamily
MHPPQLVAPSAETTALMAPSGPPGADPPVPERQWSRTGPGLDAGQLRELFAAHGRAVYEYALRATDDADLAEDVVQETLLRAWRRAPQLDDRHQSLRAWLFVVARHVVIDRARRRAARIHEVTSDAVPDSASPRDEFARRVESWEMASALSLLSPNHREVLVRLYYLDETAVSCAEALAIPVGTVKSRAYNALRALRVAMQDLGVTG